MPPSYWNSAACALAALVDERDLQAAREEGRLAQALLEDREVELGLVEDVGVGQERDRRAGLRRRLVALGELVLRGAARVVLRVARSRRGGPRRASSSDSALTTETPTPCRPPETL